MAIYNFERLIEKYGVNCQLETTAQGSWKAGEKVKGETTVTDISGAIVPISEKRINNSGGDYKQGDCEFITTTPLAVTDKTYILYNGKRYKLQDSTDYTEYADFYIYIAKGADSFDRVKQ